MLREEVMSWAGRQEFAEAAGRVASGLADPYTVIEEWLARHRIKEHISEREDWNQSEAAGSIRCPGSPTSRR